MGRRLSAISAPRLGERERGDQVERTKTPDFRACEAQVVNCRQPQDCLAGDAVMIAPVSGQIPCKQGIFQGISEIPALVRPLAGKKRACCRDFLQISL